MTRVRFWPRDYKTQRDDIFDKRWADDDTPWLDEDAEGKEDTEDSEDGEGGEVGNAAQ